LKKQVFGYHDIIEVAGSGLVKQDNQQTLTGKPGAVGDRRIGVESSSLKLDILNVTEWIQMEMK
jgi:hypothetical protein